MKFFFFLLDFQEAELEAQREEERMRAYRGQIIEEERQRLLKEHAMKLLGYLPKVCSLTTVKNDQMIQVID